VTGSRVPDFFLVGAPRSGTTSMYTYLKQHPEIYLSVLKEPHFFSTDLSRPPQAVADESLYRGLFAGAEDEKRLGEGSVWYLESRDAPHAIRGFSPSARILVMLRNPVDMMASLHALYTRTGNEEILDFEEALGAQEERARGERIPAGAYFPEGLIYTRAATFAEKLGRYFEVFGRDRVHVVVFDDFASEPLRVYRETLEFLEVDPGFVPELDLARAAQLIRSRVLRQLHTTPQEIRDKMKGGGRRHTVPRTGPSPELRSRLRQACAPDVKALGELLGRDLSAWSAA